MRVAIAGAGNVGRSIAAELTENDHEVLLIDKDPHAIKSESLPAVEWLLADACELASLEEAGIDTCDVAIAATGDDKVNLVVSLLCKTEFGVPRTVARVNHPKNEWMFNEVWGVDVSVSTPHLLTALVEEAVTVGSFIRLLSFEGGRARLAEVRLPESSPIDGRTILELGVPRDATIVAVLRNERLIVPRGDTMVRSGDEVLVLVTSESEDEVKQLLTGRPSGAPVAESG